MSSLTSAIGISSDGRYFVGRDGKPFFWLGDTQWNLWRCHPADDASAILRDRARRGFSVIQVMLMGWGVGMDDDPVFRVPAARAHGEAYPERDPLRPNPSYFRHVDRVVEEAERLGLVLVIGLDHPRLLYGNVANARAWGRWVGERYRSRPNIVWVPSYTIPDAEHLPVTREIAAGLQEGDRGAHLQSCHPDPANPYCTSGVAHGEGWLAFNTIQTWKRFDCIHEAVTADYRRVPPKPVVMAEGAYEDGAEYGFPVTPLLLRRQAYWTYLSGGHHSYGHNDNWQVRSSWRQSLGAPGAVQMGLCRSILSRVSWWDLVPDQSLLESEAGTGGALTVAARSARGAWLMAYLPAPADVKVRVAGALASERASASWIDPRDGREVSHGRHSGAESFSGRTPAGMEDALLLLHAVA